MEIAVALTTRAAVTFDRGNLGFLKRITLYKKKKPTSFSADELILTLNWMD